VARHTFFLSNLAVIFNFRHIVLSVCVGKKQVNGYRHCLAARLSLRCERSLGTANLASDHDYSFTSINSGFRKFLLTSNIPSLNSISNTIVLPLTSLHVTIIFLLECRFSISISILPAKKTSNKCLLNHVEPHPMTNL